MREQNRHLIPDLAAAVFIFLFAYTAISKLANVGGFRNAIAHAPVIGAYAAVIAWLVPVLELGTSLLLFCVPLKKAGLLASVVLMGLFTAYTASIVLLHEADRPCACGGFLQGLSWPAHLAVNLFLTALAFYAYFKTYRIERFIAINRGSRKPV